MDVTGSRTVVSWMKGQQYKIELHDLIRNLNLSILAALSPSLLPLQASLV